MNERDWFDYLIGVGQLVTPITLLLLTGVGWHLRNRIERQTKLEEALRERQAKLEEALRPERIAIYSGILEPFIVFLSPEAWRSDPANKGKDVKQFLSADYRREGFRLALTGSDGVVRGYNNLMQYLFDHSAAGGTPMVSRDIMSLLGTFLLEIRRSTGNESTKLDNWEMVEWFIKDARKLRAIHNHADPSNASPSRLT